MIYSPCMIPRCARCSQSGLSLYLVFSPCTISRCARCLQSGLSLFYLVRRMVNLGYQINNCADLVSWLIHTLGAEIVLGLVVGGALLALYLLYSTTRLIDDGLRESMRIFRVLCKNAYTSIQSRVRISSTRRRSSRSRSYPSANTRVSRCYDRPDCPILTPTIASPISNISETNQCIPFNPTPDDSPDGDRFDPRILTPATPLAPPSPQQAPARRLRRNSLL